MDWCVTKIFLYASLPPPPRRAIARARAVDHALSRRILEPTLEIKLITQMWCEYTAGLAILQPVCVDHRRH
jgi:hypothetical protein